MMPLIVISWSVLLIGLFGPYAAGYFWKKANRSGAIAAFVGGFVVWIIGYLVYLPMTKEANFDRIPGSEQCSIPGHMGAKMITTWLQ
jgi:Na+/proline symporter